jgi:hypothetical protein
MYRTAALAVAAASAFAGTVLIAPAAHATTEHCDSTAYPNKVEMPDGTGNSVYTGLAPGTEVCIKAGTKTVIVTVDENGFITQETILNMPRNAYLGISYYAYGEEGCVDNPDTYENECVPDSGGGS